MAKLTADQIIRILEIVQSQETTHQIISLIEAYDPAPLPHAGTGHINLTVHLCLGECGCLSPQDSTQGMSPHPASENTPQTQANWGAR